MCSFETKLWNWFDRKLQNLKITMSNNQIVIELDDSIVEVLLRPSSRAKRYALRVPQNGGPPIVTVPKTGNVKSASEFVQNHKEWLKNCLNRQLKPIPFKDGETIPYRGENHKISNIVDNRGTVCREMGSEGPVLYVFGESRFLHRRLTDWLKKQALSDIVKVTNQCAKAIAKKPTKVSIRDTTSQWGSCSSKGRLSFSWRLVLMPPKILEYVVAHEMAHLIEMNHSDRFWKITRQLCEHTEESRAWLRKHGHRHHTIGLQTSRKPSLSNQQSIG